MILRDGGVFGAGRAIIEKEGGLPQIREAFVENWLGQSRVAIIQWRGVLPQIR